MTTSSRRYWTVKSPRAGDQSDFGTSNLHSRGLSSFPMSPFYRTDNPITEEKNEQIFTAEVLRDTIEDNPIFGGSVNLNYAGAPNLGDVVVGGAGLPGTPYTPNIASPTELGVDPKQIPASGIDATNAALPSAAASKVENPTIGNKSPSVTSPILGSTRLGSLSAFSGRSLATEDSE